MLKKIKYDNQHCDAIESRANYRIDVVGERFRIFHTNILDGNEL